MTRIQSSLPRLTGSASWVRLIVQSARRTVPKKLFFAQRIDKVPTTLRQAPQDFPAPRINLCGHDQRSAVPHRPYRQSAVLAFCSTADFDRAKIRRDREDRSGAQAVAEFRACGAQAVARTATTGGSPEQHVTAMRIAETEARLKTLGTTGVSSSGGSIKHLTGDLSFHAAEAATKALQFPPDRLLSPSPCFPRSGSRENSV